MNLNNPIYLFLVACQQRMMHHMAAFGEIGCRTEEGLYVRPMCAIRFRVVGAVH